MNFVQEDKAVGGEVHELAIVLVELVVEDILHGVVVGFFFVVELDVLSGNFWIIGVLGTNRLQEALALELVGDVDGELLDVLDEAQNLDDVGVAGHVSETLTEEEAEDDKLLVFNLHVDCLFVGHLE